MTSQAQVASQIDSVTDAVQDKAIDSNQAQAALQSLSSSKTVARTQQVAALSKADIKEIAEGFDISASAAEAALLRANGNVVEAIRCLIRS
jgi:NACalpha-BTF3-like transcription factor